MDVWSVLGLLLFCHHLETLFEQATPHCFILHWAPHIMYPVPSLLNHPRMSLHLVILLASGPHVGCLVKPCVKNHLLSKIGPQGGMEGHEQVPYLGSVPYFLAFIHSFVPSLT